MIKIIPSCFIIYRSLARNEKEAVEFAKHCVCNAIKKHTGIVVCPSILPHPNKVRFCEDTSKNRRFTMQDFPDRWVVTFGSYIDATNKFFLLDLHMAWGCDD